MVAAFDRFACTRISDHSFQSGRNRAIGSPVLCYSTPDFWHQSIVDSVNPDALSRRVEQDRDTVGINVG